MVQVVEVNTICEGCLWQYQCSKENADSVYCRNLKSIPEGFSRNEDVVEVEWVRKALSKILEKPQQPHIVDYPLRESIEALLNAKEMGGKGT